MRGKGNACVRLGQLLTAKSNLAQKLRRRQPRAVELGRHPSHPDSVDKAHRGGPCAGTWEYALTL